MNVALQSLKIQNIPLCCSGQITINECARRVVITARSVCRLKNRFKKYGAACFVHGNTGRVPKNKRFDDDKIVSFYNKKFACSPFAVYADMLVETHTLNVSYSHVYTALDRAGIMSPKAHVPIREKKKHLPRKERPNEGDLVQMDASSFDWFLNGEKEALHGAVDDATHKITALYFCKNECLLGYYEILMQTKERCGGFPAAAYTDRATSLFHAKDAVGKVSIQEQLAGIRDGSTQWQEVCRTLGIECIIALSPQAKGRIERLWETLQGRLPFIFRFYGITTIEAANDFLSSFIEGFNARFSVPAADPARHWRKAPSYDYDYLLSIRTDKKTKYDGTFIYHGHTFAVCAPLVACKKFTLCLSERYGLRAYMNGKYWPVELRDAMCDVVGDPMPQVEKDLIYRYFLADTHSGTAIVSGGAG